MSLEKRYHGKSLNFLINIIEQQTEYTEEAVQAALTEINRQGFERSEILSEVRTQLTQQIEEYLSKFNVVNDKLSLPKSYYLNEEEVKLHFMNVFKSWNNKSEDMTPDSWQYILGAGFG